MERRSNSRIMEQANKQIWSSISRTINFAMDIFFVVKLKHKTSPKNNTIINIAAFFINSRILKLVVLLFLSGLVLQGNCQIVSENQKIMNKNMEQTTEIKTIENLLFSYKDALNASNVNQVIELYAENGVFMPSSAPSAIGRNQVKSAYEFVFSQIQLNIEFFIDEIVIHGDFAVARTSSKGTTLIHASGATVPEENRELFLFEKVNGNWKISQYMFNKTK